MSARSILTNFQKKIWYLFLISQIIFKAFLVFFFRIVIHKKKKKEIVLKFPAKWYLGPQEIYIEKKTNERI